MSDTIFKNNKYIYNGMPKGEGATQNADPRRNPLLKG